MINISKIMIIIRRRNIINKINNLEKNLESDKKVRIICNK